MLMDVRWALVPHNHNAGGTNIRLLQMKISF
uniref:Uncharacterized protein n=1 Tax=Rhizophora mucronata TaxID=61149 RepID=A0A2P2N579_RHIMU